MKDLPRLGPAFVLLLSLPHRSSKLNARPDVALVDIGLPGLDGYEVARRVRSECPDPRLKLVALTDYGQPEDRDRALAAGFDAHLVKPVDRDHLQRVLDGRV